jgi:imidazole glycerol phosphate synthase glutamine amidotransferase subunit
MGNLASVSKALERVGADVTVSDEAGVLEGRELMVLPGVGNFAAGMARIQERGLADVVKTWVTSERPLVGICLGMQLLFERSEEGNTEGLGILGGEVVRLSSLQKVPHMGWNSIEGEGFFGGFNSRKFYFVHSYVCVPDVQADDEVATTSYGDSDFVSAVRADGVLAVQFHPEKSGADGLALLASALEEMT